MKDNYNTSASNSLISISDELCSVSFTKLYAAPGHAADYVFKIIPK